MGTNNDWVRRSEQAGNRPDEDEPQRSGRSAARRDHDRVFYSAEFERLEDVTQIATLTSSSVRNRLTHSYRVEQIAQAITVRNPNAGIDVDVVATAALVHDIGHAPFGHTGEEALQRAVTCENHRKSLRPGLLERLKNVGDDEYNEYSPDRCDPNKPCLLLDGFEGNAQSFRIITLLASNHPRSPEHGLDLTRRTLMASLKYPWLEKEHPKKINKWGVYDLDLEAFKWVLAVDGVDDVAGQRPQHLEASVMDLADDIAYAVHDLEDAFKIGLIPAAELQKLRSTTFSKLIAYIRAESEKDEVDPIAQPDPDDEGIAPLSGSPVLSIVAEWEKFVGLDHKAEDRDAQGALLYPHLNQLQACLNKVSGEAYSGSLQSRQALSSWRAFLISLFVNNVVIEDGRAKFDSPYIESSMEFLKQITWYFVIDDPDLTAIREGQENLVLACFEKLFALAAQAHLAPAPLGGESKKSQWRGRVLHRLSKRLPERLNDYITLARQQLENTSVELCTPRQAVARAVVDYICSLTDAEVYSYSLQLDGAPSHAVPRLYRR
ncbi:deoxyguanosinetriphosphate triphosphohydrolase family protein [Rathayibacter sp. AY1A7]|uniref:deoxyguanosinetriphosphate triphosphohydrolase family protein n=1 Tax=Rathayibacter sp. AY1A7 TaxID=2080524 RepID=UPI000CE7A662|nr:dNTP triphosphohydrolase [Rathayibacter sp. AY1A7]PPF20845.1 hypothetical protein C5B95_07210 [Rathayibacter sp. AY1A7]